MLNTLQRIFSSQTDNYRYKSVSVFLCRNISFLNDKSVSKILSSLPKKKLSILLISEARRILYHKLSFCQDKKVKYISNYFKFSFRYPISISFPLSSIVCIIKARANISIKEQLRGRRDCGSTQKNLFSKDSTKKLLPISVLYVYTRRKNVLEDKSAVIGKHKIYYIIGRRSRRSSRQEHSSRGMVGRFGYS